MASLILSKLNQKDFVILYVGNFFSDQTIIQVQQQPITTSPSISVDSRTTQNSPSITRVFFKKYYTISGVKTTSAPAAAAAVNNLPKNISVLKKGIILTDQKSENTQQWITLESKMVDCILSYKNEKTNPLNNNLGIVNSMYCDQ